MESQIQGFDQRPPGTWSVRRLMYSKPAGSIYAPWAAAAAASLVDQPQVLEEHPLRPERVKERGMVLASE